MKQPVCASGSFGTVGWFAYEHGQACFATLADEAGSKRMPEPDPVMVSARV